MTDAKPGDIVKVLRDNRLWVVLESASPYCRIQAIPSGEVKTVKRDEYVVQDLDRLLERYAKMTGPGMASYFAHSLPRRKQNRMTWYGQSVKQRVIRHEQK